MIFISLLPLIRNDYWVFRVFEFPRAQKWVINLIILFASLIFFPSDAYFSFGFFILIVANQLYLSYQIYPYLPMAKKQIDSVNLDFKPSLKLLIANVYQENREWEKLSCMIDREKPDVVLLLETDEWWKNKCNSSFGREYVYQVLEDRENTYGMLLYSKLELRNTQIHYLVKDEIPSIETDIILEKRAIKLYAIHPEPPVPSENPKSTARDAEILLVGKKTNADQKPTIVAGDLNDVAWSYTTELFLKISGLLDPRRGRGFYSSFHAKHALARWPLDHIFCSGHFRLQNMKRMESIGSDHFPIYVQLYLAKTKDNSDELEVTTADEILADEKVENGTE
ncbi:endonuclease [Marivirga tractuosa]|nr:endonuclease/exonuclease/phosphatase family protein [Marivirga tractuosa]BDD16927.1 endonuclease [Marivirga tractuosa]